MMCESFHRVNEQSESKGIGEGTGFIEFPVLLLLAVGEIDQAHNQSQQAEGDIDRKKQHHQKQWDLAFSAHTHSHEFTDEHIVKISVSYTHLTLPTNREV